VPRQLERVPSTRVSRRLGGSTLVVLTLATSLVVGLAPAGTAAGGSSLREQLDRTVARLHEAEVRDARLRDLLVKLDRSINGDAARLKRIQARLALRTRMAYTGGLGADTFEVMITSERPSEVLDRISLIDVATRADSKALRESKVVRRRLERARKRAAAARSDLARLMSAQADDARRLQQLLAMADRPSRNRASRSSGGAAPATFRGAYACPVGASHAFRDTWGAPRSGGRRHKGTDIFAPMGSPAYAVTDGRISRTSNGGNAGLSIYVRGNDGNEYFYAHMSSLVVRSGRVRAGQLIARVGNTGNARGGPAHIHFEVHPGGGSPVNPYPYVRRFCG
jgi:murein DD-endopeptidase MepM/ murein hydrolase activator NlpD